MAVMNRRVVWAAVALLGGLVAGCSSGRQGHVPTRTPHASQQPTIAHRDWDGRCGSLLGRTDWYRVVDSSDGTCDSGQTLIIIVTEECGDHWVAEFADEYWGRSDGPLHRGRAPDGFFDCS